MRELAKLLALTGPERLLLFLCLAATPVVAVGVSIFGFRRMQSAMARWPRPRSTRFPTEQARMARAGSVAKVVAIAAGSGPVRATCLRRSLLLWWILKRDGIATVLRVGVNNDRGELRAHAWVELRGWPLNDVSDIALRFSAFDQDFAASTKRAP